MSFVFCNRKCPDFKKVFFLFPACVAQFYVSDFSNLCKFEVFERLRHQEPFVNLVLQGGVPMLQTPFLGVLGLSYLRQSAVNRLLRHSQVPNGRLRENRPF